jgi:hypothetical protein
MKCGFSPLGQTMRSQRSHGRPRRQRTPIIMRCKKTAEVLLSRLRTPTRSRCHLYVTRMLARCAQVDATAVLIAENVQIHQGENQDAPLSEHAVDVERDISVSQHAKCRAKGRADNDSKNCRSLARRSDYTRKIEGSMSTQNPNRLQQSSARRYVTARPQALTL